MRKKKAVSLSSPQKCSVLATHVYITSSLSQLSNGFKNMVAKVNLTIPSTIVSQYWPGCFRHLLPLTPIPEKLDAQILYENTDHMDPCLVESVAKEE